MSVTARSNTPKMLIPNALNAILGQSYGEVTGELDALFEMGTSDKYFEEVVMLTGTGLAPNKSEGSAIFYDTARETWVARAEHETVAIGFQLTEEQVEDNQYLAMSKVLTKYIGRSLGQTKEQKKANVLNNAFNSSYTQGPNGDGQSLISSAHPTIGDGNQSNLFTADLSESALESALTTISKTKDDRGILIGLRAKGLFLPPELRFVGHRLLNTDGRVGTADNDTNAIKDMNLFPDGIHICTRFTDSDAWFISTDSPDKGLFYYQRTPLVTKTDGDFDSGNSKFKARERYHIGSWGNWRCLFGSAGV